MEIKHPSEIKLEILDIPSSFLEHMRYEGVGSYGTLTVTFRKGYEYVYKNVQLGHMAEILNTVDDNMSVGEVFCEVIRPNYEGVRLMVNA